jgi:hypothetical protein
MVILAETLARLFIQPYNIDYGLVILTFVIVVIETICQHIVTLGLTLLVLKRKGWYPRIGSKGQSITDGRQLDFM